MHFFDAPGAGWNLGNALDAHAPSFASDDPLAHAALWGNPPICAALFRAVRRAGFETVRIPVTWNAHMDAEGRVDERWLHYVQSVVDWALEAGLYAIVNAHHEHWHLPDDGHIDGAVVHLAHLWRQIALAFHRHGERLIFEGMNEPRLIGDAREWIGGTPAARRNVNRLNRAFVGAVRACGGQNGARCLLVPTYAAMTSGEALGDLVLPRDGQLGVSVHLYAPYKFTMPEYSERRFGLGDPASTTPIDRAFDALAQFRARTGVPLVLTEFGAADKDNAAARNRWTEYVRLRARALNMPAIWWDNGIADPTHPSGAYALLDRAKLTWHHPDIVCALTR